MFIVGEVVVVVGGGLLPFAGASGTAVGRAGPAHVEGHNRAPPGHSRIPGWETREHASFGTS